MIVLAIPFLIGIAMLMIANGATLSAWAIFVMAGGFFLLMCLATGDC